VINFDIPEDPNVYFHRIGRTARAGGQGKAISLVSQDRVADFERILAQTKLPIRKLNDELGIAVPVATHRSYGGGYRRYGSYGGGGGYGNRSDRGGGRGYGGSRRSYGSGYGNRRGGGRGGGDGGRRSYGGNRGYSSY
jgi:ATP-dependent RNA helicase DeaD